MDFNELLKKDFVRITGLLKHVRIDGPEKILLLEDEGCLEVNYLDYIGVLGSVDKDYLKIRGSLELSDYSLLKAFYIDERPVKLAGKLVNEGPVYHKELLNRKLIVREIEQGDYHLLNPKE